MAQQEGEWITVNGRHIMIGSGESREEAINRAIANKNADKKNEQIAKNKEQADKLNGKSSVQKSIYDSASQKMFGKSWFDLNRDEKTEVVQKYEMRAKHMAENRTNDILKSYGTSEGYKMDRVDAKALHSALVKFYKDNNNSAVGHTITHKNGSLYIDGKHVVRFASKDTFNDRIKRASLGKDDNGIESKILKRQGH